MYNIKPMPTQPDKFKRIGLNEVKMFTIRLAVKGWVTGLEFYINSHY
jgi:hypothetical protein